MSYGPHFPDLYRRGATRVDKILKGAKPAEQPTKFEFVVDLKTAKTLGPVAAPLADAQPASRIAMELEALAPLETVKHNEPEEARRSYRNRQSSSYVSLRRLQRASARPAAVVPKRRSVAGSGVAATGLRFGSNQICSLFTTAAMPP